MRRTALVSSSAALLCLGTLLCGCGGGGGDKGYVAVGAAGPSDHRAPTRPVPPQDGIELVPLDGSSHTNGGKDRRDNGGKNGDGTGPGDLAAPRTPGTSGDGAPPAGGSANSPSGASSSGTAPSGRTGTSPHPGTSGTPGTPGGPGSDSPSPSVPHRPSAPSTPAPPSRPPAPASLTTERPRLADTDVRWCEKVSVTFRNTGGSAVTSGTVTLGTHIIGALGVDWATITSARPLPAPLPGGTEKTATWRVCVDAWRVPWGMHIDTRDVKVSWR